MKELRLQTPFERWQQTPVEPLPLEEAEEGVRARIYGEPEYVTLIPRCVQLTLADELDIRYAESAEADASEAA